MNARQGLVFALLLLGYAVGLSWAPQGTPFPTAVMSAAAALGYHTDVAFRTVLLLSLAALATLAVVERRSPPPADSPAAAPPPRNPSRRLRALLACGGVGLVAGAVLLPPALARYGPYGEDVYFLNALLRMDCGQLPYRDFEFLYGPLMLAPVHALLAHLGYSMRAYYLAVSALVAVDFALLWRLLQCLVSERRPRMAAFLLLLPFLVDTLLGLNWNAMRRLLPLAAGVALAARPRPLSSRVAAAVALGVSLAISQDYGLVTLASAGGLYVAMALQERRWQPLAAGLPVAVGALALWALLSSLLLGQHLGSYVETAWHLTHQWAAGAAGFRFTWTLNSAAAFALLSLGCVAVGSGLLRPRSLPLRSGDRLLLFAVLHALLGLRSGLHRSDFWHLDAAFLPLVVAALATWPRHRFRLGPPARRAGFALAGLLSATAWVGIAPSGSHLARGLVQGTRDWLGARPPDLRVPGPLRTHSIQLERSHPDAEKLGLGAWLARPERAGRPVFFYLDAWTLPIHLGVCREDYLVDDFLLPEDRHPVLAFLAERPSTLVVMGRGTFERLRGNPEAPPLRRAWLETPMKRISARLASDHIEGVKVELGEKERLWRERIGGALLRSYRPIYHTDHWLVLSRAGNPSGRAGSASGAGADPRR